MPASPSRKPAVEKLAPMGRSYMSALARSANS